VEDNRLNFLIPDLKQKISVIFIRMPINSTQIFKLTQKNHHDESNIRLIYTGGVSPDAVTPAGNGILMVNDMIVVSGKPGKVTRQIMDLFRSYTKNFGQGKI
jgi:hypothetical protein